MVPACHLNPFSKSVNFQLRMSPRDEGLDIGDRVRVELIGTDVERGFIDFARAGRAQGG
jgi:hypothetical protein